MKSIGDWMLGMAYFQQNELNSAEKYFIQIFENHFTAPSQLTAMPWQAWR